MPRVLRQILVGDWVICLSADGISGGRRRRVIGTAARVERVERGTATVVVRTSGEGFVQLQGHEYTPAHELPHVNPSDLYLGSKVYLIGYGVMTVTGVTGLHAYLVAPFGSRTVSLFGDDLRMMPHITHAPLHRVAVGDWVYIRDLIGASASVARMHVRGKFLVTRLQIGGTISFLGWGISGCTETWAVAEDRYYSQQEMQEAGLRPSFTGPTQASDRRPAPAQWEPVHVAPAVARASTPTIVIHCNQKISD